MSKEGPLDKVNPFGDRNITGQLDAWAAALEAAVSTLNQTLSEFRTFQEKGEPDDGAERASDTTCGGGQPSDSRGHG